MPLLAALLALGLANGPIQAPRAPADRVAAVNSPAPLTALTAEALQDNPAIRSAEQAWQASTRVAPQVSALPDPQVTFQELSMGSPRPFTGFTTSPFAYSGFGVMEALPFPGTLALRGRAATQESDAARDELEAVQRQVRADVTEAYAQLGAVQETLSILGRDAKLLDEVERVAETRYRVGQGTQQDVIEAQLQQTRLQEEVALQQEQHDTLEAQLKEALGRAQASPDILVVPPAETPLARPLDQLLALAASANPDVNSREAMVRASETRLALARKAFDPDFTLQFMWQHTAEPFPDMYMVTVDARVPLFWHQRQVPALAEAGDQLASARDRYTAGVQAAQADVRRRFARAATTDHLLTLYRQGLIPQARAAFQAGLAGYESGSLDFQSLIKSFADVLALETDYWHMLSDHETAVARIAQLTGLVTP